MIVRDDKISLRMKALIQTQCRQADLLSAAKTRYSLVVPFRVLSVCMQPNICNCLTALMET